MSKSKILEKLTVVIDVDFLVKELPELVNKIKAETVLDCIEECKKEVYYGGAFDMKYMGEYCDINKMKNYANKLKAGEL
jgi:hypothetical protein